MSRSTLFRLDPLSADAVRTLLDRGLEVEGATANEDALDHLVDRADGDARAALNALEVAVALAEAHGGPVTLADADAALDARAVEFVGLPEAQLNLAHAVVYLATAPKSNRAASALWKAQADVRDRPAGVVPRPLRDTSYRQARRLGHGKGYLYPHDAPEGFV